MSVKILAVSSHSLEAYIIKIATFSKWNHVAICFDDKSVIDSTLLSGVRLMPLNKFKTLYKNIEEIEAHVPDQAAAQDFALRQLGKSYDWTAILGIIFQKRKWNDISDWFCSELSETIISKGGVTYFKIDASSILPRESHSIARGEVINLE